MTKDNVCFKQCIDIVCFLHFLKVMCFFYNILDDSKAGVFISGP